MTEPLEVRIGTLLRRHGLTLATAESCTGGLLGHRLTNVPGSSDYYLGGVIAYANAAKVALLGVEAALLARAGAVSAAVARQMALGARERWGADIGLSTTGIAGPAGGTAGKPVGLVYIALASERGVQCERHAWPHDRAGNKAASAERALELLGEYLARLEETARPVDTPPTLCQDCLIPAGSPSLPFPLDRRDRVRGGDKYAHKTLGPPVGSAGAGGRDGGVVLSAAAGGGVQFPDSLAADHL